MIQDCIIILTYMIGHVWKNWKVVRGWGGILTQTFHTTDQHSTKIKMMIFMALVMRPNNIKSLTFLSHHWLAIIMSMITVSRYLWLEVAVRKECSYYRNLCNIHHCMCGCHHISTSGNTGQGYVVYYSTHRFFSSRGNNCSLVAIANIMSRSNLIPCKII